jgi:NitT/TauT family transport system ATP-binding protein
MRAVSPTTRSIELLEVTKHFERGADHGAFTAVSEMTLALGAGEFLALVGPSGCGKSTLLNLISGLEAPSSGRVAVEGRRVDEIQRQVGYLFQKDALLPWKTVRENIEMPLVFRRRLPEIRRAAVDEWVGRVGLRGFETYYPHQLSGGMRKRVALAATFVYEPHILLMDEPFSALDVQTRNLMENELLELWREHRKTVVFVTHDLEEAIALADRIVVMTANPGRVKREYRVDLPRPRNVNEIRFDPRFRDIHEEIWSALKDEVLSSHARQLGQR